MSLLRSRRLKPRGQEIRLEAPIVSGCTPPNDLDAEAYCLESCINSAERRQVVLEILKPAHFYSDSNSKIYEAIVELDHQGVEVSLLSVQQWLSDRERLAYVGGQAYLNQIGTDTAVKYNVKQHAERVFKLWRVRQVIAQCQRIAAEGYGDVGDIDEWIENSEGTIYDIAHQASAQPTQMLNAVLKAAFEQITAAAERGDRITGVSTGYEKLDAKTAGLHDGDLTIVAARPGMGKTSFVLNLAVNVASPPEDQTRGRFGLGVAVFSLEMPREQLGTRMACSEGRVDVGKLRQGFLQPDDWRRLTEASRYLSTLPIWIDDTPAISLMELRAKVRKTQFECERMGRTGTGPERVGLVIIDYLQLMKGRDGVQNREQEISEISRGLKQLAKELRVPVIALSQLNRSVETRSTKDKRPQLSDLRESGAIEQDADNIIFLYRPSYYDENYEHKKLCEVIIGKQRNGPTGKVLLRFEPSCTRFDNLAPGEMPSDVEDE